MAVQLDPDVRFLQALADPVRLSIIRQIAACDDSVCACDFVECCTVGQPTISHHLKVLREAGLIAGERRGTWVYYRIRPDALRRLAAVLALDDAATAGV
jgi:ArsR family transcriptional regulator